MTDGPRGQGLTDDGNAAIRSGPERRTPVPRLGVWAWSLVGVAAAASIVALAFAALSEILLPLTFAAVLAVIFKPWAHKLQRHRVSSTLAAGLVVLGLLATMLGVVVATVRGVTAQADEIGDATDAALAEASEHVDTLGVDAAALDDARSAVEAGAPMIGDGLLTTLVSGVGAVIGLASGVILGALIMYYLLKDGTRLRRTAVNAFPPALRDDVDHFIGDACRTLRAYGRGRTVMSISVAAVIGVTSLLLGLPLVFTIVVANFVGGYIPYIGAFLGGGLAVIVALGDGGLASAAVMLVMVLASNLLLENFVEPKVMGTTLDVHPVVVLIVTALGGLIGGVVGLILAVPSYVIARDARHRFGSRGLTAKVAERAEPTVQRLLT